MFTLSDKTFCKHQVDWLDTIVRKVYTTEKCAKKCTNKKNQLTTTTRIIKNNNILSVYCTLRSRHSHSNASLSIVIVFLFTPGCVHYDNAEPNARRRRRSYRTSLAFQIVVFGNSLYTVFTFIVTNLAAFHGQKKKHI